MHALALGLQSAAAWSRLTPFPSPSGRPDSSVARFRHVPFTKRMQTDSRFGMQYATCSPYFAAASLDQMHMLPDFLSCDLAHPLSSGNPGTQEVKGAGKVAPPPQDRKWYTFQHAFSVSDKYPHQHVRPVCFGHRYTEFNKFYKFYKFRKFPKILEFF